MNFISIFPQRKLNGKSHSTRIVLLSIEYSCKRCQCYQRRIRLLTFQITRAKKCVRQCYQENQKTQELNRDIGNVLNTTRWHQLIANTCHYQKVNAHTIPYSFVASLKMTVLFLYFISMKFFSVRWFVDDGVK